MRKGEAIGPREILECGQSAGSLEVQMELHLRGRGQSQTRQYIIWYM